MTISTTLQDAVAVEASTPRDDGLSWLTIRDACIGGNHVTIFMPYAKAVAMAAAFNAADEVAS